MPAGTMRLSATGPKKLLVSTLAATMRKLSHWLVVSIRLCEHIRQLPKCRVIGNYGSISESPVFEEPLELSSL
jgi:hypothetical protein